MLRIASNANKISRVLSTPIFLQSERLIVSNVEEIQHPHSSFLLQNQRKFSAKVSNILGISSGVTSNVQNLVYNSLNHRACYTTESTTEDVAATEEVKEIYDKMYKSIAEGRTIPPNAWTWSLIYKCSNLEDIKLLFQMLESLRIFRLTNLRINRNFNDQLCLKVVEACIRAGAIDYGKKTLWEHNVYGLTPLIGSAHRLLMYAKEHKDVALMEDIMKLLKENHLPLQPGTADLLFSTCYETDNWELLMKYSKKFLKSGTKLRLTTLGTWMEFASKRGDVEYLWKIEKMRSDVTDKHSLASAFSCAKGFLLESKPESVAAIIHVLNQTLPEKKKRSKITVELQKLVSEWPVEVIKHQKEEDRKALATSLRNDIHAMITSLFNMGLNVTVNLEDLNKEAILS
ncbi:hypothetical protein MKW98_025854 [Papaver atlanticum]|uniref:Adenylyl cyclase n=1 Tax=Papaver atlanticum TaxID=357466 RepID=A0AAD4RUQ5_9MAGN|nr:hypothetical protein MKW98_025854 [Papaver atlanticum]